MPITIFNPQNRQINPDTLKLLNQYQEKLDLIACIGGDGTILGAELKYPNTPKLPIKSSFICHHCPKGNLNIILKNIFSKKLLPKKLLKISATSKNISLAALNEINIKNTDPTCAIRFDYKIYTPNKIYINTDPIIADGILVSTPFGSTGYFYSINQTIFEQGIGITLNNATIGKKTIVVKETSKIEITIIRGPATIYADNNPTIYNLQNNQTITIQKSPKTANIFLG